MNKGFCYKSDGKFCLICVWSMWWWWCVCVRGWGWFHKFSVSHKGSRNGFSCSRLGEGMEKLYSGKKKTLWVLLSYDCFMQLGPATYLLIYLLNSLVHCIHCIHCICFLHLFTLLISHIMQCLPVQYCVIIIVIINIAVFNMHLLNRT